MQQRLLCDFMARKTPHEHRVQDRLKQGWYHDTLSSSDEADAKKQRPIPAVDDRMAVFGLGRIVGNDSLFPDARWTRRSKPKF